MWHIIIVITNAQLCVNASNSDFRHYYWQTEAKNLLFISKLLQNFTNRVVQKEPHGSKTGSIKRD